jgi:hypothetical protein
MPDHLGDTLAVLKEMDRVACSGSSTMNCKIYQTIKPSRYLINIKG